MQSINGYWYIAGELYALKGEVKFAQYIRVAKKRRKNAVFILFIGSHELIIKDF